MALRRRAARNLAVRDVVRFTRRGLPAYGEVTRVLFPSGVTVVWVYVESIDTGQRFRLQFNRRRAQSMATIVTSEA